MYVRQPQWWKRLSTWGWALAAIGIGSLPTVSNVEANEPQASSSIVKREFFYEKTSYPECHASTIEETSNGLVAAWFGGTYEKHPDVGIWFSRYVDGKWTDSVEVANGIQYTKEDGSVHRYPLWNPVLEQVQGGPLYLFYKEGPTPADWWGMVMSSQDGGKTWDLPRRLPEGILGPVKNKGIFLEDGSLLCPTSTELGGPWRVYFELSKPPFQKWYRSDLLATSDNKGGIQPSILRHPDGKLQALCRCDRGSTSVLETWSTDDGKHWSPLKPTSLPNPNSGIDAITLKDGRHLLVYNHTKRDAGSPKAREMLNVAISQDGVKWLACETLERTEKSEFSYPAVIQTKDGMVHITYTWNRKKVAHVVLDPAKLNGVPIAGDAWPK